MKQTKGRSKQDGNRNSIIKLSKSIFRNCSYNKTKTPAKTVEIFIHRVNKSSALKNN